MSDRFHNRHKCAFEHCKRKVHAGDGVLINNKLFHRECAKQAMNRRGSR